jgi:hypothetical protein
MERDNVKKTAIDVPIDLGTVICKHCGHIIATLPTNGVKVIHGVCEPGLCREPIKGGNVHVG